jgi:hypothetical protein
MSLFYTENMPLKRTTVGSSYGAAKKTKARVRESKEQHQQRLSRQREPNAIGMATVRAHESAVQHQKRLSRDREPSAKRMKTDIEKESDASANCVS